MSVPALLGRSLLVVVAHPDDEVIGVGGQLARWGQSAVLVHVTDGAPPGDEAARAAGFATRAAYGEARRRELGAALACLPAQPAGLFRIGAADQRVTHELYAVLQELRRIVSTVKPDIVITHPYEGGHPDHDALAFAVSALRRSGLPFVHVEFACYHEGSGGTLITNRFSPPASGAEHVVLTRDERRLKRLMLCCFRSQQKMLSQFRVDEEWLRRAPPYDFGRPPNRGRVWYDRFDWGLESTDWRDRIASLQARLAEENWVAINRTAHQARK